MFFCGRWAVCRKRPSAAFIVYLFYFVIASRGKLAFGVAGEIFAATVYILLALNSIIYIRDFDNGGEYLYILIFMGAWVTDIFAYFLALCY